MRSIGHRGAAEAKQLHEGSGQSILLVGGLLCYRIR